MIGGSSSYEQRHLIAAWVASEVMPHEPRIRAWLSRRVIAREDVDDIIQEAYCRLAGLTAVDHIDIGHAYFFSIARNLLTRRLKRLQVVSLETIAEIESYQDEAPLPDQVAGGRIVLAWVVTFMTQLPERCRQIVHLRKIEGWSQRQIAEHLNISEKVVEKQVWLGVKAIRKAWAEEEAQSQRCFQSNARHAEGSA